MVNWGEFGRMMMKRYIEDGYSHEDELHFYKLPADGEREPLVFNLLWNNNYIVFNNGNDLSVNQHMKAKAVELSDLIYKKLEGYIWGKLERLIEHVS
jgi:hypothetical protein